MKACKTYMILLLLLSGINLFAQTQVEVITKTINKTIPYLSGLSVSIQGQGARILVTGSESNEIELTLKLISKGLNKKIAEKELAYQKYVIDELNETIVIRNYLLLPNNVELSTIQEAVIEIKVPNNCDLSISNSFGSIELKSLEGKLKVTSEYGDITIQNFIGQCNIKGNYGDIKAKKISGRFIADLDHTELELSAFSGSATIDSNLGSMLLIDPGAIGSFRADGEKTDLVVRRINVEDYHWDIRSKYGQIEVPHALEESDMDKKENRILTGDGSLPKFQLITDFGSITVEKK